MLTSKEILAAAKDVAETTPETKLEDFCGISPVTLDEVLSSATEPMNDVEQTYFVSGLVVALRAVRVQNETK